MPSLSQPDRETMRAALETVLLAMGGGPCGCGCDGCEVEQLTVIDTAKGVLGIPTAADPKWDTLKLNGTASVKNGTL